VGNQVLAEALFPLDKQLPSLGFHEDKGLSYAVFFVLGLWIGCALGVVVMILAQKWRRTDGR
jgi:hypothetical protein